MTPAEIDALPAGPDDPYGVSLMESLARTTEALHARLREIQERDEDEYWRAWFLISRDRVEQLTLRRSYGVLTEPPIKP